MRGEKTKFVAIGMWALLVSVCFYAYIFHGDVIRAHFINLSGSSLVVACIVYLIAGSMRGFTLIPVTYLIVAGLLLLPPLPLYVLTLIGVMISSASIYYFSEYLNLDEYFESNHKKEIERIKGFLSRYEMPVVVTWSFMPFLPTDLICYVCGTLEVDIKKFLLGVLVGEGISCALYIFLGKEFITSVLKIL